MSRSSHRDDFFQTSASLEEQKRKDAKSRNTDGSPIKLQSKILAVAADPVSPGSVYVAQSGGTVRKILLETGETAALFKGPTAPVTSICFSPDGKLLFAGCWDKTVWSWDVASKQLKQRYEGHSDFVRSVTSARLQGQDLLISGGADAQILVFDIASGKRLYTIKGHAKGIQDLVVDPASLDSDGSRLVFSAGSDREIRQFDIAAGSQDLTAADPLLAHDTSVYKLFFDGDGDMWTASADKTAKCLVREDGWKSNLTLTHPDFVRDVVVYEQGGWVITACRDEEVRVWNRSTGQLYHTFSGHFEEVTGLALVGSTVVSVSIDATIRQWSLSPDDLLAAVEKARDTKLGDGEEQTNPEPLLTEEEERELAELMGEE
ncbi:WD40 repeat domain-containing protein [Aspergillus clavatus NRRL 1]|uniref:WD repeat protein n=1 Tax=Aspergillus clavatus (strain ATCC 1007 / CBS 513.65 / DSM 816 / NCTC 3887 / NRRL 1 / QM 1276 / 107) TaxID=344612 RepID=A1CPM5_ASPCL|nr:WD repeat protein [Aspergillus clavatus NRRL 1]EAW07596.1 WD repeat protein [Aspergillus clavatus NRRL 1]